MTKNRIAELRVEATFLGKRDHPGTAEIINECADEIKSLQSRVAELEKDKARVDWIEAHIHTQTLDINTFPDGDYCYVIEDCTKLDAPKGIGETFRQAIDAAMKGTNEH